MNRNKISIQAGLPEIEQRLRDEGYEVVHFGENDLDAGVSILCGVDEAYEEIQPSECRFSGDDAHDMLVINATNMSPDDVLNLIRKNPC